MKLHELAPAPGSTASAVSAKVAVSVAVTVKQQVTVTKVKTLVPAAAFVLVSRVDKILVSSSAETWI